ncbi:MAG: hypothetical protein KGS49_01595 [Planctomycetes bacterium]|nr:hypothetical protein [Planctomycetota bacterium]
MMNDDEYRQYLDALARKYLHRRYVRCKRPFHQEALAYELERLTRLKRLNGLASDELDDDLLSILAKNLIDHNRSYVGELEESGVLDALDDDPETLFKNLRRNAIPDEDADFLRDAGCNDPEAELTLLIAYARTHLFSRRNSNQISPTSEVRNSPEALSNAGERIQKLLDTKTVSSQSFESKTAAKRKIVTGVGNILTGAILATGNVLLGTGNIVAPNAGVAFGVIGSCAAATSAISKGMGELRGE